MLYTTIELRVDKTNEKGIFVAKELLSSLHIDPFASQKKWYQIWGYTIPRYRYFIHSHGGQIHIYIDVPTPLLSYLQSQIYAYYSDIEVHICTPDRDFLHHSTYHTYHTTQISDTCIRTYASLVDTQAKESLDPLSAFTAVCAQIDTQTRGVAHAFLCVDFSPVPVHTAWYRRIVSLYTHTFLPRFFKKFLLKYPTLSTILYLPFVPIGWILSLLLPSPKDTPSAPSVSPTSPNISKKESKWDTLPMYTQISLGVDTRHIQYLPQVSSSMQIYTDPKWNSLTSKWVHTGVFSDLVHTQFTADMILSTLELAGIVHMPLSTLRTPGICWSHSKKFEPPHTLPTTDHITPLGETNFRGVNMPFGILPTDRMRHTYIIWKTGMWKSTLLENMIYNDILAGHGVAIIDPHGDLAETILRNIPKNRTNDIVIFDPSDKEYPIAFNMLDSSDDTLRPMIASGLVSTLKKLFAESWGPRLEYILRNSILTLLHIPESTLISIPLLLTHGAYRAKIVSKISDPLLSHFWREEFEKMPPNMRQEAINPILNKVWQFLSAPLLRNILGQPKNPFRLRWIMDNQKIFIVNLSKWKIGEDASALLGAMMVSQFQIEAMTRADIPEKDRKDFHLYVDEFQNFATDSFATILSEARKYKLSLTLANQYIAQMPETVQGAVFGNVGTIVSFQVGYQDASVLTDMYGGEDTISPNHLMSLEKYHIYLKLLIRGMPSGVFSAITYPPLHLRLDYPAQQGYDTVLRISREKYTRPRATVEKKISDMLTRVREM